MVLFRRPLALAFVLSISKLVTHCGSMGSGEQNIYFLRDRINSEFWDLVSCELFSVGYVERRKHLSRDIQEPDAWLKFMRCHQINVGCFLACACALLGMPCEIGIISFRVRFPDEHHQLQVQVTTAHQLQVQDTSDISFANSHITSSFASCDDLLNMLSWMASWGEEILADWRACPLTERAVSVRVLYLQRVWHTPTVWWQEIGTLLGRPFQFCLQSPLAQQSSLPFPYDG